ncbi:MAG: SMC-Scp complex subunit ScpB [Dokdonella sp.]|uniref:SMC-Scp complex subunit ScpB n=1 Tax=Dokdonella sp. TaxID=2291710 RepID=UPI003F81255B
MELQPLKRIIEAALLASAQPLSLPQMSGLFDEFEMPSHEDLARAVEELKVDADGRGIELVEVASGFRYQVRSEVHAHVCRLWSERQTRYSRALLETLSLIAYRQPITRAEIEQIRGVAVSTNIVRTLEEREWVRVVGYRDLPGKPALFGTTKQFLDYFNLKSLDELPPLGEIRDIEELDPQLALDEPRGPIPARVAVDDAADETAGDTAQGEHADVAEPSITEDVDGPTAADDEASNDHRETPTAGDAHEDTPESIA